jgi:adenylosuccinate lyase
MQMGQANPLADLICGDARISAFVDAQRIPELLRAEAHIGDAPERAQRIATRIRARIG